MPERDKQMFQEKEDSQKGGPFEALDQIFRVWDRIIFKSSNNTHIYAQTTMNFFLSYFGQLYTFGHAYKCKYELLHYRAVEVK